MTVNEIALVVTMVVSLVGAYLGFDARRTARERRTVERRDGAEGDSAAAKAVEILLVPLNKRISELANDLSAAEIKIATLTVQARAREKQISDQQSELDEFRAGFTILVAQMREANIIPRWQPRGKPDAGHTKS